MISKRWAGVWAGTICGLAAAQTPLVPLRWTPEPEKSATYDVSVTLNVEQREDEGESRAVELRQDARVSVWVEQLGEDGSASLLGRMSGVRLFWRDRDRQGSWGGVGEEPKSDVDRALAAIGGAATSSGLRVTIDAAGAITGFSGLDGVRDAFEGQTAVDESVLGMLDSVALGSRLAPVFQGDSAGVGDALAGAGARRVGSEWKTTERVGMGSAGTLEITTTWALREVVDGVAVIEGVSSVSALPPDPASPGSPMVRVEKGEGTARAEWDLGAGALRAHETRQALTMVWTLGDLSLRQEQASTSTLRRALEE